MTNLLLGVLFLAISTLSTGVQAEDMKVTHFCFCKKGQVGFEARRANVLWRHYKGPGGYFLVGRLMDSKFVQREDGGYKLIPLQDGGQPLTYQKSDECFAFFDLIKPHSNACKDVNTTIE